MNERWREINARARAHHCEVWVVFPTRSTRALRNTDHQFRATDRANTPAHFPASFHSPLLLPSQERLMATAVKLDELVNLIPAQYYIGKTVEEELEFVR